jgi:DNA/RNA endonuclease YhcR with UshA esterase domain
MRRSSCPVVMLLLVLTLCVGGCGELTPAASPVSPTAIPESTAPPPSLTPPPTATAKPAPTEVPPTAAPTEEPPVTELPAATATAQPTTAPIPTKVPTALPAPTSTPELVLTPLSAIPDLLDQEVTVQATIIWVTSFSQGFKFLLDDGTGQATLLLWLNVYDDCWAAPDLLIGATVRASGVVGRFEGEWQIEPDFGGDVKALTSGSPPPQRQIGAITVNDLTARVTIEGTVTSAESFSSGQRIYVDDGTGTILVLLWQNIFERIPENARLLTPGTRVRVSGVIEEYKGTLEIVPRLPYSVAVL